MYHVDLEGSHIEMRISRMLNETVDPEYFRLQEHVKSLNELDAKLSAEENIITRESEKIVYWSHQLDVETQNYIHEKGILEVVLQDINLVCEK